MQTWNCRILARNIATYGVFEARCYFAAGSSRFATLHRGASPDTFCLGPPGFVYCSGDSPEKTFHACRISRPHGRKGNLVLA